VILLENTLLNLWLIPGRGVAGVAIALLISELTLSVLCLFGFGLAMRASPGGSSGGLHCTRDLEGI